MQAARVVFPAADRAEIAASITDILSSGMLTLGAYTQRFEADFAAAHRAPHAVATSSGTAALEISLRAIGVAGRDVIVPANTFYATAAAVLRAGAGPSSPISTPRPSPSARPPWPRHLPPTPRQRCSSTSAG